MDPNSRRRFLGTVAAGTTTLLIAPTLPAWARAVDAGPTPAQHDEPVIVCKLGARTLIDVVAVDVGAVRIALVQDPKTGAMAYGKQTYGDLQLTLRVTDEPKSDAELVKAWFEQSTNKSGGARRDISVFLYARDKSTIVRTYHAKECFPISLDAGDHSTASEAKALTLVCKVGSVSLA